MGRVSVPLVVRVVIVMVTATACGPIAYTNEVTRQAASAVDTAHGAQADKYAPYYWTRATQYLHQARVKAAAADFEGANRFGRLATEAAEKAVVEAEIAAKDPSKRPLELQKPAKKPIAPAKDDLAPGKDEP